MAVTENQTEVVQLKGERTAIKRQFRLLGAVSLVILGVGTVFFHRVEHWSWPNSVYFCVMTLATVGYGDFVPKTSAGKVFDIFYVLAGIGIIAAFANAMIRNATARRQLKMAKGRRNKL